MVPDWAAGAGRAGPATCQPAQLASVPATLPGASPLGFLVVVRGTRCDHMVDHLGRQIAQEATGHAAQLLARQPAPAHATQVETLHRARERHIAQAAFFLDGGVVVDAALVGNTPSSRPTTSTSGNSRPLAVCTVIKATAPFSGS